MFDSVLHKKFSIGVSKDSGNGIDFIVDFDEQSDAENTVNDGIEEVRLEKNRRREEFTRIRDSLF